MQLNARIDDFKGNGNKIYQVIFTDPYGYIKPDEINVEFWLANSEEHLNEQLHEEFVDEGTFDEDVFNDQIMDGCVTKQIGTVISVTND